VEVLEWGWEEGWYGGPREVKEGVEGCGRVATVVWAMEGAEERRREKGEGEGRREGREGEGKGEGCGRVVRATEEGEEIDLKRLALSAADRGSMEVCRGARGEGEGRGEEIGKGRREGIEKA
jgi:hypothetical protein